MTSADGERKARLTVDDIQVRLTNYACELNYNGLSPEAAHAAKVRVIDSLGALLAGFFAEPCRIARNLAAAFADPNGATVIGTRMKTALDMAAFVNCTTARYPELTDGYVPPGSFGGHPSDLVASLLAVGEYAQSSGRELIASIVLGYEVYTRMSDQFDNLGFDHATFNCLATAVAAGKLLGLSTAQLAHGISMAIVPNNTLRQVRTGHMSMFKAAASGQAARAGVFAALLARAGMEGPYLPFEGKSGWCDHIAKKRLVFDSLGAKGTSFKILDTSIKMRACSGFSISSVLAAEKVAPVDSRNVKEVVVEVYERALDRAGSGEQRWNPDSRETADHSIPYLVAATLMDGTVTLRTFDDAHLWNAELRTLMQKIKIVENPEFTKAFKQVPQQHCTRLTLITNGGERLVGRSGGETNDLGGKKGDEQITEKFRRLSDELLGSKRVSQVLERLWHLDDVTNVASIPSCFVVD